MKNNIKIGLFGFGCVGQGFYQLITREQCGYEIIRICTRHDKVRNAPASLFTTRAEILFNDPEIDIIVEAIDDANAALQIAHHALQAGRPVITANKKMLAENLQSLLKWQNQYNTPVLYEAAIAASIPIVHLLSSYYKYDQIKSISGIINGSSNFILSKITDEQRDYNEALTLAQQLGFAESNPFLDVSGLDSGFKLSLIIYRAFGLMVDPNQLLIIGIDKLSTDDFQFAADNGLSIKLVAEAVVDGAHLRACVTPTILGNDDSLYHVKNEDNAITIEGHYCGHQLLGGKGAGSLPTAFALTSDLHKCVHQHRQVHTDTHLSLSEDGLKPVFIRSFVPNIRKYFQHILEEYHDLRSRYIIGYVSVKNLKTLSAYDDVTVMSFTQKSLEHYLQKLSVEV